MHGTANTASARDEASYATRRSDSVSSHYYVDDSELIQSLDTDLVAWHAGNSEGNNGGIAYEFTGQTSWSRSRWLSSVDWAAAGRQMARDCHHWDIPARWLTVDQLKAGWSGLTTHNDVRRAWGGAHTDPGPGFPRDVLLEAIKGDDMPSNEEIAKAVWNTDGVIKAPPEWPVKDNTHLAGQTLLRRIYSGLARMEAESAADRAAMAAAIAELSKGAGVPPEQVTAAAQAGARTALSDLQITWSTE